MKPIELSLTIKLPPDGTPEREELYGKTLGELLGIRPVRPTIVPDPDPPARASIDPARAVRPHRPDDDEPANVQAAGPGPKMMADEIDGGSLFRLVNGHGEAMRKEAQERGKRKGYGWKISEYSREQATAVYRSLLASHPELREKRRAAR